MQYAQWPVSAHSQALISFILLYIICMRSASDIHSLSFFTNLPFAHVVLFVYHLTCARILTLDLADCLK